MMVRIHIIGEDVEAIIDSRESALVIGLRIAAKLGALKRARKVKVRQGDRSHLSKEKYMVKTLFSVFSSGDFPGKFPSDIMSNRPSF